VAADISKVYSAAAEARLTGRTVDQEANQIIQPYLVGTEHLRWSGRPKQGLMLRNSDAFLIPFSLLWGGFAFYWEYGVFKSGGPSFFLLFVGALVLMGLYIIFGRFIYDAIARTKTYYGISDKRIVIASGIRRLQVKSVNLPTL